MSHLQLGVKLKIDPGCLVQLSSLSLTKFQDDMGRNMPNYLN